MVSQRIEELLWPCLGTVAMAGPLHKKKPFSSQEKKSMVKIFCLGDSMGNLLSGQISEFGKHDVRIFYIDIILSFSLHWHI